MNPSLAMIVVAPILLTSAPPTSFAHAWPRSAVPPAHSTVNDAPKEVAIVFSEPIEPRFSTIEVTNALGRRVDDDRPRLVGEDPKRLGVGITGLTAGTYSVVWHATSVDTHQTNGQYRFTVADPGTPDVRFDHVWARPTAAGATTGAVYFSVTATTRPDRLTGASSPVAATTELHQTINDNGVMKMRAVPSIDLIPGKPVVFSPGGYHVMLTGLKSALKAGDSFPLTLTFEHAPPVTVTAKVEATSGPAMKPGGMDSMPGMHGH